MTITGQSAVSVAMSYAGTPFQFGGWLPSTGWDCSGAMGYWLGRHLGMVLPGGYHWTGRAHGPLAVEYKTWSAAVTVTEPEVGDLCCWATHVGLYIGGGRMISAFSAKRGTTVTPTSWGPLGETLSYRRIKTGDIATDSGAQVQTVSGPGGAGCATQTLLLPLLIPVAIVRRRRAR